MANSTTLCPSCGFNNPAGMRFCGNCGTRLAAPMVPASTDVPSRPVIPSEPSFQYRFRQAGREASGQRRNVTVLFVDLSGFTSLSQAIDNEDLYELIQQYTNLLIKDVYKYEGTVDKLTGDGLMALFGAPITHENNAERAVHSALDMQTDVRQFSALKRDRLGKELQIHIGLNSGSVVVGGVGSDMVLNYTAIGDTVNLASRLETAAGGGEILVSESVYKQTHALFEFEASQPMALKGIAEPVIGYRVKGARARPGSVRGIRGLYSPMVGRENELQQLIQVLNGLTMDKRGAFVMVTGEAGLGKSRLTSEIKNRIQPDIIHIHEGHSLTYRKSIAYWIFQDLMRDFLGLAQDAPEDVLLAKLVEKTRELMGSTAQYSLPYLEYMLSLPITDPGAAERIRFLDAGQLRQQIFLSVRDVLIAECRQNPVFLILEDLHWADETSLDLIQFLLDSIRKNPLVILAISRPTDAGGVRQIQDAARKKLPEQSVFLQLEALPAHQSQCLLEYLLAIPDFPEELGNQITQRAAGNPFYLEEILRKLIEDKVVFREEGHWRMSPGIDIKSIGVPETLQDLILDRFDHLPMEQRKVLQTAAVIGQRFSRSVLNRVVGDSLTEDLTEVLTNLVDRQFILPDEVSVEDSFSFKHVIVSDAIYSTLLRRNRKELHGRVAQAIETLYASRLDGQIELLANHYLRSGINDKALHYVLLTGKKAAREYANEQARQYFEQALNLLPTSNYSPEQAYEIQIGMGDVLLIIGEYQTARDHFQSALDVLHEVHFDWGSDEQINAENRQKTILQKILVYRKIASSFERQGDFDKAMLRLNEAQSSLGQLAKPEPIEKARILHDSAWVHFRRGNLDEAETQLLEALSQVEGTNTIDLLASIYNRLGGVYFRKGELSRAGEYTQKSLVLREQIGDILGAARSYNNLGLVSYATGQWSDATRYYVKDLELQKKIGDAEDLSSCYRNLAELQIDLGELKEARNNLDQSLDLAQQIGAMFHIAGAHSSLGRLLNCERNYSEAIHHLEQSGKIFQDMGAKETLIDVYYLLGEAHLGLGDADLAAQYANNSIEMVANLGSRSLSKSEQHGRALRLLGKAAVKLQDWETADRQLRSSLSVFKTNDIRIEEARSLVELGKLYGLQSKAAEAREFYGSAETIFTSLGAKAELDDLNQLISQ